MTNQYTARMYLEKDEIMSQTGDDVDALYTWLLTRAESHFGNVHGEITDNKTHHVVKKFRKSPPD